MKLLIKIMLFLLSWSSISFSQTNTKIDTIKWSNYLLIIEVPKDNHIHKDSYEEGFFQTINCLNDSAIITIHCGAMVNLPLINLTKYNVSSEFNLCKEVQVLRGFYEDEKNGVKINRYFREENYKRQGLTIMYENVIEKRLDFYNHILNNIKVLRLE